jgi:hypothetical protein
MSSNVDDFCASQLYDVASAVRGWARYSHCALQPVRRSKDWFRFRFGFSRHKDQLPAEQVRQSELGEVFRTRV